MSVQTVTFHWSDEHGECYDCGLPAAFVLADRRTPTRAIEDHHKRCAVCAANDAAAGVPIERIDGGAA